MTIAQAPFGSHESRPVVEYVLTNAHGLAAHLISFGARLTRMIVPDRHGRMADVVLGFDDLPHYVGTGSYFGATCGRYGNRIEGGRFLLDGRTVQVTRNEGANHLHGGARGFDKQVWDAHPDERENSVTFSLVSSDGDEGFPGNLLVQATYELTDDDRLLITMSGTSDRTTILNMVHHTYWNVAGHDSGSVLNQVLEIPAGFYTPVDGQFLATGEILSVAGSPFDFRRGKEVGRDIAAVAGAGSGRPAEGGLGYDHNWILDGSGPGLRAVATLRDLASGRSLTLRSTEPGVQVYAGGRFTGAVLGKGQRPYRQYAGLTFETQKFPGSPTFAHFPSTRLDPGAVYDHRMDIRFFAE